MGQDRPAQAGPGEARPDQARLLPASELAGLDLTGLESALKPLWEDAGWLAGRLLGRRFGSWDELVDAAAAEMAGATGEERAALLSAHPRLGGNKATLLARSRISWAEQGGDRATDRTAAERLAELNDRYESRFGFPFVEWVNGRPLEDLIPVIELRLGRSRTEEIDTGCAAMISIARDRLARLRPARTPTIPRP